MNIQQYQLNYPYLASFANDPNSPTYTRTSKTGKKVLVRKGRMKKGMIVAGTLAATLGGAIAGKKITGNLINNHALKLNAKHPKLTEALIKNKDEIAGVGMAAGAGVGLVGGAIASNAIRKKRNNR